MNKAVHLTIRLIQVGKRVYMRKWGFLGIFVVVFFVNVWMLASLDLLPSTKSDLVLGKPEASLTKVALAAPVVSTASVGAELPTKILIPAIGLSASIANSTSVDVEVLDELLLGGAVRYPTSAKLGETGNVVLFGHSSYLPIVRNRAYKTFNGIQKLVAGDVVTVYSSDTAYTYRVRSVTKESANNGAIPLAVTGQVLTLATCNSFGTKEDRFVVVADFVERHSISI